MFCPICGTKIPEDSMFCEQCGAHIDASPTHGDAPPSEPPSTITTPENHTEILHRLKQLIQTNPKKAGLLTGAAALLVAVVLILVLMPPTIRLNDYVIVEFSGYNTSGNATYYLDEKAFCQDYAGKLDYRGTDANPLSLPEEFCSMFLQDCVSGELSKSSGLSNGEEISFVWSCDDDIAKETYGVRLSYSDLNFTVGNLNEPKSVDPFEGIELVYSGTAPNGEVYATNTSGDDYYQELFYSVEPETGLRNGDTITVSLPDAETEEGKAYYLDNYGVIFSETQKTFTVDGLKSYVAKLSEMPKTTLDTLTSQGKDVLQAEAADRWDDSLSLDSVTYLGSYLLVSKNVDDNSSRNNMLYLVYQVQSSINIPDDGIQEAVTYYYTVRFDDLIVEADKTVTVDLENYSTPNNSFQKEFGTHSQSYRGYESLDNAFQKCVSANADEYGHESSIPKK